MLLALGKTGLSRLDLCSDAAVPTPVAMADEFRQPAVLADRGGDLQTARKGVHPGDMRIKQIFESEALAPDLGVEIRAAGGETAVLQNRQHDLARQVKVGGELVGVPSEEHV